MGCAGLRWPSRGATIVVSLTPAARYYLLHAALLTGALGIGALFYNLTIEALGLSANLSRPAGNDLTAGGVAAAATLVVAGSSDRPTPGAHAQRWIAGCQHANGGALAGCWGTAASKRGDTAGSSAVSGQRRAADDGA